jgi:predicted Zn-dependent protease with MMP-like domain
VLGVYRVSRERFEELVAEAYESLPVRFRRAIENVALIVEDRSPEGPLLGLYQGIPLTERGVYAGVIPDRITIFQDTVSAYCNSEEELVAEIRTVVVHEVGHYFGIDDDRLEELGWA